MEGAILIIVKMVVSQLSVIEMESIPAAIVNIDTKLSEFI